MNMFTTLQQFKTNMTLYMVKIKLILNIIYIAKHVILTLKRSNEVNNDARTT